MDEAMKNDSLDSFPERVKKLKEEVRNLQDEAAQDVIEQTAVRLERLNYAPAVVIPQRNFLRLTKEKLLVEIERILALPDREACALAPNEPKKCEDIRLQCIAVQIYYYKKLILLRQGNLEEWDEIDELYVHD